MDKINASSIPTTDHPLHVLRWHHNESDDVSNHQPHDFLLNRLFRRSKKLKLRFNSLCEGNSLVTGEFPQQGPVTPPKKFAFHDIIMTLCDQNWCHGRKLLCAGTNFFTCFGQSKQFVYLLSKTATFRDVFRVASDAIRSLESGSASAQAVTDCCQTAQCHYWHQFWLIITRYSSTHLRSISHVVHKILFPKINLILHVNMKITPLIKISMFFGFGGKCCYIKIIIGKLCILYKYVSNEMNVYIVREYLSGGIVDNSKDLPQGQGETCCLTNVSVCSIYVSDHDCHISAVL